MEQFPECLWQWYLGLVHIPLFLYMGIHFSLSELGTSDLESKRPHWLYLIRPRYFNIFETKSPKSTPISKTQFSNVPQMCVYNLRYMLPEHGNIPHHPQYTRDGRGHGWECSLIRGECFPLKRECSLPIRDIPSTWGWQSRVPGVPQYQGVLLGAPFQKVWPATLKTKEKK